MSEEQFILSDDLADELSEKVTTSLIISQLGTPFKTPDEIVDWLYLIKVLHIDITEDSWKDILAFAIDNIEFDKA